MAKSERRTDTQCLSVGKSLPESPLLLVAFAVLFGLLAALVKGYGYGMGDQQVHIPEILRILDSGYLANDFAVNATSGFGPRFYYSNAVALVARHIPLEIIFSILFLAQPMVAACITALAARDITGSTIAAMLSVVLVMSLNPFYFGDVASVFWGTVIPAFLALPFTLLAIWMGIRGKPLHAAWTSTPAILIHPMAGIEGAMIALAAAMARLLYTTQAEQAPKSDFIRIFRPILAPSSIIAGVAILFWLLPAIQTGAVLKIETGEFVQIIAHYRHPLNLVPSTWPLFQYLQAGMFASVVLLSFMEFWRNRSTELTLSEDRARKFAVASVFVVIMAAFLVGYIFVEVIPTRIVAQAYVYRMLPVFVWLGWILIAYSIANLMICERRRWVVLFMVSTFSAVSLFVYRFSTLPGQRFGGARSARSVPLFGIIALLVAIGIAVSVDWVGVLTTARSTIVAPGFAIVLAVAIRPKFAPASLFVLGCLAALVVLIFALDRHHALPEIQFPEGSPLPSYMENVSVVSMFQPILTVDEGRVSPRCKCHELAKLATVATRETDPDSVFLIPSNWRNWRLFSERAAVVDGQFMPFRDEGMVEWHERHLAIYNPEVGAGYPDEVTETKLLELWERYEFDYAVVPAGADIGLPVLDSTASWKLVRFVP